MNKEFIEWFRHEHPDSYGIKRWITGMGGKLVGWFSGYTPSVKTKLKLEKVMALFPRDHMDESGITVHVMASDAELYVMAEDWLSGCIPNHFYDMAEEAGVDDPYDLPEVTDYCLKRMGEFKKVTGGNLEREGWKLLLDQPFEYRASRFVWIRPKKKGK